MFLRLFIVSARDAVAQYEIEQDLCELKAHLAGEAGYRNAAVVTQDDGLAVGFISLWATREDAQRFHASGLNSLYTTVIALRITDDLDVKLFRVVEEERPCPLNLSPDGATSLLKTLSGATAPALSIQIHFPGHAQPGAERRRSYACRHLHSRIG